MKTKTAIGIIAIVILIVGAIMIATKRDGDDVVVPTTTETTGVTGPNPHDPSTLKPGANTGSTSGTSTTAGTYTMAEVATHNSAASCWSVIRGGVFDLTTWINKHPGGPQAILGICGIDGTTAFDNQHEGQGRPEQTLATFKIGTVK